MRTLGSAALAAWLGGLGVVSAQEPQPSGWLPPECLFAVSVPAPVEAVRSLAGAAGGLPTDLPDDVQALAGAGMLFLRSQIGGSVEDFVERMAGSGAAFGVLRGDGKRRFLPVLVTRPGDPKAAAAFFERFPRAAVATHDDLLLVSNAPAGLARLRAHCENVGPSGRAAEPSTDAAIAGRVDLLALRELVPALRPRELGVGPGLLFAPLVAAFGEAAAIDLRLLVDDDSAIRFSASLDAGIRGARAAGLLAAGGDERDLAPLPRSGIAQIALDRSVAALLRVPEEFVNMAGQLQVQSFLSIADAIDGATTSFTEDLVGGLGEPILVTIVEDEPPAPRSPFVLPGIVLSAPMKGDEVETVMRRAAQVFAVIVNAERAQNRRRPFLVRSARSELGRGLVAEPPPWRGPGEPPVEDALTPTLLFGNGHVVLATTLPAAEAVLSTLAEQGPERIAGDRIQLRGPTIARALERSRSPLELARMLDEGETPREAARFWDIAIALANVMARLDVAIDFGADATTLVLELERAR